MPKYNNLGLVNHAKQALNLKTKYMWGGILRPIEQQYDLLRSIYGNQSGTGYTAPRWAELAALRNKGYYGVDCVGLVKSYYWSGKTDGGVGSPKYGAKGYPDTNANGMFAAATKKGKIATLPEIPGLIVYCKSHPHVGIYIGNGETIESTLGNRGDGVVKRKLDDLWEWWFACPYIDLIDPREQGYHYSVKYAANARRQPSLKSGFVKKYYPGEDVYLIDPENVITDSFSRYKYVQMIDGNWIVLSALKKA